MGSEILLRQNATLLTLHVAPSITQTDKDIQNYVSGHSSDVLEFQVSQEEEDRLQAISLQRSPGSCTCQRSLQLSCLIM
jgi:hypothetical protein